MKQLNKKFIIGLFVLGIALFCTSPVFANSNLIVEFEKTPLFDEVNFLPGQSVARLVKVTNNSGQPQRIAVEAINWPEFPEIDNVPEKDLSRALDIVIREKDGSDLYGGSSPTGEKTLFDFYQDKETYLSSDIPTNSFKEYEFEVIFPAEREKEWQAATTTFDILIGFQGVEGGVPPGGGGGLPPGLTIIYEKAFYIGTTTATITWTTSYFSTSQVVYDILPGQFDLNDGPPKYGYAFSKEGDDSGEEKVVSHSVTISGLTPNTTYYYRCVSHGSFAVSIEHSFTTFSVIGEEEPSYAPEGAMEGEEEPVYAPGGVSPGKEEEEPSPAVSGASAGKEEPAGEEEEAGVRSGLGALLAAIGDLFKLKNLWWLLLLLLLILIILYLLSRKKKKDKA